MQQGQKIDGIKVEVAIACYMGDWFWCGVEAPARFYKFDRGEGAACRTGCKGMTGLLCKCTPSFVKHTKPGCTSNTKPSTTSHVASNSNSCLAHILSYQAGLLTPLLPQHSNKVCSTDFISCTALEIYTCSSSSSSANWPKTSPYRGSPASLTGGLPQPPAWYPNWVPGGMGAFRPGTCTCQR